MSAIDVENAKQIRTPFEVYCTFMSREDNNLGYSEPSITGIKAQDTNFTGMLQDTSITMRELADLANGGFRADGTAEFDDGTRVGSQATGKMGIRTNVGGSVQLVITGTSVINSLTITTSEGEGTLTANGTQYAIRRINVVPVNATSITLLFAADEDSRVSISSITAGLTLEFDNENLVHCTLALRSNLDIIEPTWQVSEIELKAYYPDDIAEAVGNVGDNVPIMYYAGYVGDYSTPRTFYMSEKASMEHNVITIKGVDASNRLEDYDLESAIMITSNNQTKRNIYEKLRSAVRLGLGEGVTISEEAAPPVSGLDTRSANLIWTGSTSNKVVADIMNKSHKGNFHPAFIDAGIPTIRWSLPTNKWDIYEEDCADVVAEYDRNINKLISSNGDYPIQTDVSFGGSQLIDTVDVEPYTIQSYDFNGYVYSAGVTNASSIIQVTPQRIAWVAGGGETCDIWGSPCNVSMVSDAVTYPRLGVTQAIEPSVYGRSFDESGNTLFPNYAVLFDMSNLSGSFTFKGDPRMQPRDVFTFHRLDGTSETCMIETITLTHEGGGTSAQVTYRKGVV